MVNVSNFRSPFRSENRRVSASMICLSAPLPPPPPRANILFTPTSRWYRYRLMFLPGKKPTNKQTVHKLSGFKHH